MPFVFIKYMHSCKPVYKASLITHYHGSCHSRGYTWRESTTLNLFPFSFLTSTSCNWNLKVSILIWSWFCDGRMQVNVTLETEVKQEVHHLVSGILSLLFLFWLGISVPPVHLNQKIIQEFVTRASENRQE